MAQATIAARVPTACAACYGQYPDRVHVDFRSAIDGAAISDAPRAPRVEWVVICEDCIRHAYGLLPEVADERENLRRQVEVERKRAEDAENYSSSLEDTLQRRPTPVEPANRPPRAQRTNSHTKGKPKGKPKPRAPRQPRYAVKTAA